MKIYVASSWRCPVQPNIVAMLREAEHTVYDFRNPPENSILNWSGDKPWWSHLVQQGLTKDTLTDPTAHKAFTIDMEHLRACDLLILVLPCGRSAHLEAGWAVGSGRPTCVLLDASGGMDPELMYLMADFVAKDTTEMMNWVTDKENARMFSLIATHGC